MGKRSFTRGQSTPSRPGSLRSERTSGGGITPPTPQDSAGNKPGESGYNPRTDPLSTSYVGDVSPGSQGYTARVQAGWTGLAEDNKLIAKTQAEVPLSERSAAQIQAEAKPVYKISGKLVSPEEYAVKKGLARGEFEQQFRSQKILEAGRPREVKGVMTFEEKALTERLIREREQKKALTVQVQAKPSLRPVKQEITKERIITGVKKPFSLKTLLISPSYYFNVKELIKGIPAFLIAEKQAQLKIGQKLKDIYAIPGKKAEELRQPYETKEDLALKRKIEGLEYQTTTVRKRAAQRVKEQKALEGDLRKYEEDLRQAAESGDQEKYNKALSLYESKYGSYKTFVAGSQVKSTAEFKQVKKDLERFNVQFEKKPVKVSPYLSLLGIAGTDINVKNLIERYGKTSEYEEKRAARIKAATPFMIKAASTALDVGPEFALGLLLPQEAALMYGRYAIGKLGYQAVRKPEETITGLYKQAKYSPERLAGPPLAFAGGVLTRQYLISKLSREELILKNFEEKISKRAVKTQDLNLNKLLSDLRQGYFIEYTPKPIKFNELLKEKITRIPGVQDIIRRTDNLINRISGGGEKIKTEVTKGFKEGILEEPVITEMTPAVIKKAEMNLYKAYSPARRDWLTRFEDKRFKVFVNVKDLQGISGYNIQKSLSGQAGELGQLHFNFGKPKRIEAAKLERYDILKLTGRLNREFSVSEPSIKKLMFKPLSKEVAIPERVIGRELTFWESTQKELKGIVKEKDVTYYMTKKRFADLLNKMNKGTREITKTAGEFKGLLYEKARISRVVRKDMISNVLSEESAFIKLNVEGLRLPSERGLTVVKPKPTKAGTFDIRELDFEKRLRLSEPAKRLTGLSVKQIRAKLKATLGKYYEPELKFKTFFTEGYERGITVFRKPLDLFKVKKTVFKKTKTEIKPYEPSKTDVLVGKGGQVQILKQELKLKEELKIKTVNLNEYLKTWEAFKETVKERIKRKQRERQAAQREAEIITGVEIVEPFLSKVKGRVKTVLKTGRAFKVKTEEKLESINKQERMIAALLRQSDANINKQLLRQAQPQAFKQAEKQASSLFQPSSQYQPQAEEQLEDQIIRQDSKLFQDLIRIPEIPELVMGRRPKPEKPKIPFMLELELEKAVNTKIKQKAFNVFVRRKKSWDKINANPLDVTAAFNLGSSRVDNTAAVSFKLVQAKSKVKQELIKQTISNAFKFRAYRHKGLKLIMTPKLIEERMALKKKSVFIEDNKYRIDSPGERGEIRGVDINKIVGGLLK